MGEITESFNPYESFMRFIIAIDLFYYFLVEWLHCAKEEGKERRKIYDNKFVCGTDPAETIEPERESNGQGFMEDER